MKSRLLTGVLFLAAAGVAHGAPIGILDVDGLQLARISRDLIDFGPAGWGVGDVIVTVARGDMADVPLKSTGTITDLSTTGAAPGAPLTSPIDPFLVLPVPGTMFSFALEQIDAGGGVDCAAPPAPGRSCTPLSVLGNSPFVLTNDGTDVRVSFSARGTVTDLANYTTARYRATFTATVAGTTIPDVLGALATNGRVESSWSAEFNSSPAPEPCTVLLAAAGLVLLKCAKFRGAVK